MNYLKHCLSSLVAICALGIGASYADDLSVPLEGIWKATASTDSGDKYYTITITKEGDTLGGNIVEDGKDDGRNLDRVKVDGKSISIEIDVEADGQKGVVKVAAEETTAGSLAGKWSIVDSAGTELMGGEWEAKKEVEISLAGVWDSEAELPEGDTLVAVLTVSGKPGDYSGKFETDDNEGKVESIEETDGEVKIGLLLEREGVEMEVEIRSEVDGNDLVGSWHLLDGNGGESATGGWKATKREEFSLAGTWNVVAILPEGEELNAVFEVSEDGDDLSGKAKIEENELELKSIKVADKGGISMTLDYEAEGIPGLVTIKVEADGNNVLEGGWAFASADGSENHEGKLSATRATKKRGVLRGR